ncbi:PTS transporter subunit EIIB [Cellulomonas sp. NPDC058312]|uniref:PTS transporter subunit EIIB n=1 Tax=Cellulomonas sp. NPDC058312 TaxID=3346441 RepID=UPI0036E5D1DC
MSTDAELGAELLVLVGGAGNVEAVTACASRLRFVLRDHGVVDTDGVRGVGDVVMVVTQGGQLQVVLGARAIPVSRVVRGLVGG